eukprot:TRINITY_DN983_c0_g1_i20.p1 TRINITY_DN983_c0_g1~~TRINITY_DN983_c0_g1_i20.p1  ORF type:complete len:315 (+),score=41.70 TRINITY_DN983_c0_g1_i20:465-1409(+)
MFWKDGNFFGEFPWWFLAICTVAQLHYMILDNADGKQARKTKSSSPLGLLFDHGCDALNVTVIGLTFATITQFGSNRSLFFSYLVGTGTFYAATLEEYYVNGLFLPVINGANEGVLCMISTYIVTAIYGTSIWTNTYWKFTGSQWLLGYFILGGLSSLNSNYKVIREKAPDQLRNVLKDLGPLLIVWAVMFVGCYLSSAGLIYSHARLWCWFIGINFSRIATELQVAHVTNQKFHGYSPSTMIIFALYVANTLSGFLLGKAILPEYDFLVFLLILSFINYIHLAYNLIRQMTRILNIKCWSITKHAQSFMLKKH